MIPDDELYLTETQDPATHHWPYSATLKGTRLTLYSQYSIEGAIGYVQKAMIEGFKGSYAPVVLSYRHKMMIISRDVNSRIAIDLLDVPGEQMALKFLDHQMSGYSTWADAHKDARFRLSQATWNGVEEESEPLVGYAAAQAQFGNWARKQKVERAASTDGREVLAQEGDQESRSR